MYTRPTQTELVNAPMLGDGWSATAYRVGDYAVKRYRRFPDHARHSVLEGERRLREAGLPVVPVIDHWVADGRWHCAQPAVETPDKLDWSDDQLRRGMELAEQAYNAGVSDIKPDNVGLLDGEMTILDTGELDPEPWEIAQTLQLWRILLRQR